jgi:GPH family glycoside/pentoside/hexuronide:cation symporter
MEETRLSVWTKLGYGICDLGGNLFFTVTAFVLLNFLTDTVGLAAGLAGTALMVGRIWDAFYDPVIGYASDRTVTKWGRRRPYIFAGSVPLFFAMALMFINPSLVFGEAFKAKMGIINLYFFTVEGQIPLFFWVMVVYIILCTAYSTVNIPYSSMTPELTADYHERTSLNAYRFACAAVGTLLGAGAALPLVGLFADKNIGFAALGTIFGAVMTITALITVFSVREPKVLRPSKMAFFKTYLTVFKNGPYIAILLAYVLHILGITTVSAITIYYFKYIIGNEALTTVALAILIVLGMIFIPVSVVLSKKVGKRLVYGAGMVIMALMLMVMFYYGHLVPIGYLFGMLGLMSVGFGFMYAMPYAIVPDAIEYDYLKTGQRREGAFYGIWTWALKIGQALSAVFMGWFLQLNGYLPNVEQTPLASYVIRLFLGPIPAFIFMVGALTLVFYPISEKRYAEIMAEIKKKEAKAKK